MRPTLPMQKSNGKCGNNIRVSGPYLSSPVVPSSEEEHRKSPEPLDIALARDMTTNPLQMQALPVASYSGPSHNSTFISGFPPDLHFSSFSPHERPLHNSPFISQSSREFQSTRFLNYSKEEDENSWSSGHLQSLLDFPDHGPISNGHVEGSDVVMSPEGQGKQNEWKELIEKEFYNDDPAETNWNDFFADSDIPDQQPRVLQSSSNLPAQQAQVQQQHPLPSNEVSAVANPASSAQTNKPRMRWTPELHEAFVDAVNQLGGSERATPKGVLRLMNVEGLTIYHVKSHLQKYRTARVRPEPSEVTSDRKSSSLDLVASLDLKTNVGITEALKLQMEVQKKLHEQLEIQRKLQLEMEAQGKRLLEMFEQQRKMEKEKLQATSSSGTRPSANDKSDPSELDQSRALSSTSVSTLEPNEGSHNSKGKLTAQQTRTSEDHCPDNHGSSPPPMKRPKMGDPDQC